jgi:hypothetical protein
MLDPAFTQTATAKSATVQVGSPWKMQTAMACATATKSSGVKTQPHATTTRLQPMLDPAFTPIATAKSATVQVESPCKMQTAMACVTATNSQDVKTAQHATTTLMQRMPEPAFTRTAIAKSATVQVEWPCKTQTAMVFVTATKSRDAKTAPHATTTRLQRMLEPAFTPMATAKFVQAESFWCKTQTAMACVTAMKRQDVRTATRATSAHLQTPTIQLASTLTAIVKSVTMEVSPFKMPMAMACVTVMKLSDVKTAPPATTTLMQRMLEPAFTRTATAKSATEQVA